MKALCPFALALLCAAPASATVTVSSPANGSTVTSPFQLSATASACSSQPISAMGYSLDNSSNTTIVITASISAGVTASTGAHVLHVKSWGSSGASCVSDIDITVASAASPGGPGGPTIPPTAVATKAIQNLATWKASYDTGTGGSGAAASGVTSRVLTPSVSGSARKFATSYSNYGGERYSVKIGSDPVPENFVYDTKIYVASPSNDIANIEMDMNQVMSNGQTVIFGFQCDGWSNTWDYTENAGTPASPDDRWLHSNQTCNPQKWSTGAWHHVVVSYSRDSSGNVTYHSVWLDGTEQDLGVTVLSSFALGWAPTEIVNFQVDGMTSGSGSSTIYLDNTTVYSW